MYNIRFSGFIIAVLAAIALSGCGTRIEVPPAHVAKINTPQGLSDEIIRPSKIRLSNFCVTCDSIILLEAADKGIKETMTIFMPKDRLNMSVDIRGTISLSDDKKVVDQVFSRITPEKVGDRISKISLSLVYGVYAQPVIRETIRSILTRYSIMEVMENRDAISKEISHAIGERLNNVPIKVLHLGLANVQPPDVIVKAQESAKEREIAIRKAEADKQVALKKAEAAYEVAVKQQQVDLKEAETQVLVNKKLAEGVNEAFIAQRALRIMEAMARSGNKVFFVTPEMLSEPGLLVGMMNRDGVDDLLGKSTSSAGN